MFEKYESMLNAALETKYDPSIADKLTEAQQEVSAAQAAMNAAGDAAAYAEAKKRLGDAQTFVAYYQGILARQTAPSPETVETISAGVKAEFAEKAESIAAAMKPHLLAMNELISDYYASLKAGNEIITKAINEFQPDSLFHTREKLSCSDDARLLYIWRSGMENKWFEQITGTPAASTHEKRSTTHF